MVSIFTKLNDLSKYIARIPVTQRLLGRYKKRFVNWLYCVLKVKLLMT
mgnify:CR=1 FL=1